jgi:hypothetical protein
VAIKTKELLEVKEMDVLADKGYHTGVQLEQCRKNNINSEHMVFPVFYTFLS